MMKIHDAERHLIKRNTGYRNIVTNIKVRNDVFATSVNWIVHLTCFYLFLRIVNQWEERRKKAALRGFYKELRKSQQSDPQTSSNLENAADEATRYVKCLNIARLFPSHLIAVFIYDTEQQVQKERLCFSQS